MLPTLHHKSGSNTIFSWLTYIDILVFSVVVTLFLNSAVFTYYNANPLIKSDGWRFIQIYLTPWLNSKLSLMDLWCDHHPTPLNAVLFLANASLFDLRMDYEGLFSIIFSFFSLIVLWRIYNPLTETTKISPQRHAFILLSTAFLCSLTSTVIYTWPLVTQSYIFIFFMLLVLTSVNHLVQAELTAGKFIFCTLCLTLILLVFSDTAKLVLYSCCAILLGSFVMERKLKWLIPILAIITAGLLQFAFLNLIELEAITNGQHYNKWDAVVLMVDKFHLIPEYLSYIGIGLFSSWLNFAAFIKITGANHTPFIIMGMMMLAIYLYSLYFYFKNGIHKTSIIPGTLVITAFCTGAGAALFRFHPETQTAIAANIPRYYLLYVLGNIGIIWIWCLYLQDRKIRRWGRVILALILACICASQILSLSVAWDSTRYRKKAYLGSYTIMLKNADGDLSVKPPRFMTGYNHPEPYLSGLQLLKKHKLNLFSEKNIMEKFQ